MARKWHSEQFRGRIIALSVSVVTKWKSGDGRLVYSSYFILSLLPFFSHASPFANTVTLRNHLCTIKGWISMYPLEATIVRLQDTIDLYIVYVYVRLCVCVYVRAKYKAY